MVQRATLTYLSPQRGSVDVFELDSPETIVGRAPLAVRDLPDYADLARNREAFQVRLGDTLFVVIAWDLAMCRQHFCIHRALTESGETVYFLRDLNSRCGTYLNDTPITKVEHLKAGDRIRCSSRFLFDLAPENSGHRGAERGRI
jgi:hypothetical protein